MLLALIAVVGLRPSLVNAEASALAPPLGDELTISDLEGNEYGPAIAYNSNRNEYLVVWHDVYEVLHARRVSSTGQLLDSFLVSTSPNGKRQASVAYDPGRDRYLVTWVYDYYGNASDLDVYGRFIPWDGPSASSNDFAISSWSSDQLRPVVVFAQTEDEYLVVWMNSAPSVASYISGRRIFADGSGFPPGDGFPISSGTEDRDVPDVAYNLARNEYLVTWEMDTASGGDIYGLRLSATGASLGSGEFVIAGWPSNERIPSVAACETADQYLVAWQSDQDTGGSDWAVYGRFLSGEGVLGSVPLIDDTTAPEQEVDVSCDATGQQYLLAWETMYAGGYVGVWARIAHPDETLEAQFGIVQPGASHHRTDPAVGGGGDTFLTAWEHEAGILGYRDIHGRLVLVPEPAAATSAMTTIATLAGVFAARRRGSS